MRPAATQRPSEPDDGRGLARLAVSVALALILAATAWFRVDAALSDPEFDARDPAGLLKSDPGLLHGLAARIVAAGGAIPADFAHEEALEHPGTIDVAERFPLHHLWLVARVHLLGAPDGALHVTAVVAAAVAVALALLGVFGLAREASRSAGLALAATLLAAATPAFHRGAGFVWLDEDWFWAPYALHLALAARALRVGSTPAVALCLAPAALAFATWHAAGYFLALEGLVLLGWTLARGRSPLARGAGALVVLALVATALLVPFLRASGAYASLPVALAAGAWAASFAGGVRGARLAAVGATAAVLGLGAFLADGAHAHVGALILAKLEHAGLRPPSAAGLPADVRLMWQGPFETPSPAHAATSLSLAGAAGICAALWALRVRAASAGQASGASSAPGATPIALPLAALFALALAGAWFAERALVLPALLAPALAAWLAARIPRGGWLLCAAAAAQIALLVAWRAQHVNAWYHAPRERQAEIRWMLRAVDQHVPRGEAVAADFMSSGALYAQGRHRIVFSPKWEAREPRRRAAEFLDAFHHTSPAQFHRLLVERYRTRWLVVDRFTLLYLARWSAGLPPGSFEPLPGSAAAALCARDEADLRAVPGYELVARSPAELRLSGGAPSDFYRLYRLSDAAPDPAPR
jgi:hypothetical protein